MKNRKSHLHIFIELKTCPVMYYGHAEKRSQHFLTSFNIASLAVGIIEANPHIYFSLWQL